MKAMWTGVIQFSLVSAPIKVYAATETHDIQLNHLHGKCGTRINLQNFCSSCDTTVQYADLVKGYEFEKGKYVTLTSEDLSSIREENDKIIDIAQFVNIGEVDPIFFEKAYYIGPDKGGERSLGLLHAALKETGKVAVGTMVLRNREHVVLIRAGKDALIAHMLMYSDEIRDTEEVRVSGETVSEQELNLAVTIISNLSSPLDLSSYKDTYVSDMEKMIQDKINNVPKTKKTKAAAKKRPVDLMDTLVAAVQATQKKQKKGA